MRRHVGPVLITGCRGYLGAVLAARLQSEGCTVLGVDSAWFEQWALSGMPVHPWLQRDLRDLEAADFEGVDAIVHLAALSNDPLGELEPELTEAINVDATVQLARNARAAGVRRFVFASSCSVYGAAGSHWVDETSPPKPLTPYAVSKVRAEKALQRLADDAFCSVVLRFATLYGFSPSLRLDLVANNLAASALATGEVLLRSDGAAWRPLLHVEDAALAVARVLEAPAETITGEVLNVGSEVHNYRIRDLAATVCRAVPEACVRYAHGAGADRRSYRVRFRKFAERFPDAVPERDVTESVRILADEVIRRNLIGQFRGAVGFERTRQLRWLQKFGLMDEHFRWRASSLARSTAGLWGR